MELTHINFDAFPDHILHKIVNYSLSIIECDIKYNLNLKLVSKLWYSKINTIKFWKDYSKIILCSLKNNSRSLFNFYNNHLKQLLRSQYINTEDNSKLKTKLFLETKLYNKLTYTQSKILKWHNYNNLFRHINEDIYDLFNIDIINIPVCYFKNSKCIDNICGIKCASNYHGLLDYCNHYLMRGVDDCGRFYLILFYKNNFTKEIFYEFIYSIKYGLSNNRIFTYSGYQNNCYIGNISFILNQDIETRIDYFKRELNTDSYDYLYKLINFENCGNVYYDETTKGYIESNIKMYKDVSIVSPFFDKKRIEFQIKLNKYYNYSEINIK
jgi:hypothetical protein